MKLLIRPFAVILILSLCFLSACATVGKEFDESLVKTVQNGKTTKGEVLGMFGKPFKTGLQNGDEIWIYEVNTYTAGKPDASKNLTIVFSESGVVKSHQMMSSSPGL